MRRTSIRRVSKKAEKHYAEMRALRPLLLERSLGACEARFSDLCTGVGVHAHHVLPRGRGGADELKNLLWVCLFCHDDIHHARPAAAYAAGVLRSPYGAMR